MRVMRLKADDEVVRMRCMAGCGKTLRAGQVVLVHRIGALQWDKQHVGAHARCVAALLADAPEDLDDFETVQARLAAGGPLFPDVDIRVPA